MVDKLEDFIGKWATNLKRDTVKSQTVRGELKPFVVSLSNPRAA
jgi:hypothetical protein